jgi:hypothetical protein
MEVSTPVCETYVYCVIPTVSKNVRNKYTRNEHNYISVNFIKYLRKIILRVLFGLISVLIVFRRT